MSEGNAEGASKIVEKVGNPQYKVIKLNRIWLIENFMAYTGYETSIFSIDRNEKLRYILQLHSNQYGEIYPSLILLPSKLSDIIGIKYKYSLLNENGKRAITLSTIFYRKTPDLSTQIEYYDDGIYSFSKEYIFNVANKVLKNGRLTIFCQIEVTVNELDFPVDLTVIDLSNCDLKDDIGRLFEDHKFSDFTINVDGKMFPIHKNVLTVRSPVFAAIFEHNMAMSIKQENVMDVTDIEPEVFKEMLCFIYTNKAPNVNKMAEKLLMAAHKYQLEGLKLICDESLRNKITIDNAVDILIIADISNAKCLRQHAIDFISRPSKISKIAETEGYHRLLTESHLILMAEILRAVAFNQK